MLLAGHRRGVAATGRFSAAITGPDDGNSTQLCSLVRTPETGPVRLVPRRSVTYFYLFHAEQLDPLLPHAWAAAHTE